VRFASKGSIVRCWVLEFGIYRSVVLLSSGERSFK
jgi:hypothetical protein